VTSAVGQLRLRIGDTVRIRDERWRVAAESSFGAASIIEVDGCDATNHGTRARFLLPFETVDSAAAPPAPPRFVTIDRWRRAARSLLAGAVPRWTSLRTAARANFTVLPFQLEPAIAVASGDACRVLIADEVGLGKTIQALALLEARREERPSRKENLPSLVVVPRSLVFHWKKEAFAFAPKLRILDHSGATRLKPGDHFADYDVVLTTYGTLRRDALQFKDQRFDYCILDEAQAIKNSGTLSAKAVRLLRAVVPEPVLARLERADDGVSARPPVRGRVLGR